MAQHYDITKYPQKKFRRIESAFEKKFESGVQKVKNSLRFIQLKDERVKEHPNDTAFETSRMLNNERERFEIHFDEKRKTITKIYLVK
ncbi:hypothetical protein A2118_02970 [Candidatus Kaiserbacteria bacterium GWA2_50_9]|uniref:Uncharacterized protein n=1 Tax=Candidatus Kaiserbacteria bacterium GWA2_50_9 TaxID=1798474 RepID=A0A1F6BT70_9BACT|nr:MAG: hypothetical protein A2118_02970 [Candidatus Kaiserbacteria bacterium GWA2_50_9]